MIAVDRFLDPVLRWIGETSLQVALLGSLLLAIESLGWRFLSARSRVWLWALVLFRLVLPPVPAPEGASIVSDAKLMARIAPSTEPGSRAPSPTPIADSTEVTPDENRARHAIDFSKLPPISTSASFDAGLHDVASTDPSPIEVSHGIAALSSPTLPLLSVWAAGFLGVLLVTYLRERRFRARLRAGETCRDPSLLEEIDSAARAIGLRRSVEVIFTDVVAGPAATGIRRARLLLPPDFARVHDVAARRCVLLHELAHLRHRDAAMDAALIVLRAAYWFHPVVHLALRRLHQAREELRDDEALSVEGAPPPSSYAHTLLAALERGQIERTSPALAFSRGHEWRRRLTMIQNHGNRSGLARIASGFALVGIGAGVLLGASTPNFVPPMEPASTTSAGLDRIRVEGYAQWPSWRLDLERKLEQVIPELRLVDMNRRDALSSVTFLASLNVLLDQDVDPTYLDEPVDLVARSVTIRDALDLLLVPTQTLGFECFDGGIRIAHHEQLKPETETRFYSLAPFVQGVTEIGEKQDVFASVIDLLRAYADPIRAERFEDGSWSIGTYRDLLVMNADRAMHDATKSFLERLLGPIEDCAKEPAKKHAYDESIDRAFATRVSVDAEERSMRDVLDSIGDLVGVSVHVNANWIEETVRLRMQDAPAREVLTAIGRQFGLHPTVRSGVIYLAESPEATVEMYEIGGLVPQEGEERGEAIVSLYEVIRSQIDPQSWDAYSGFSFSILGSRMVVRQTPANQAQLRGMLAALEKALGGTH